MQTFEWTTGLTVIALVVAIVLVAFGYVLANARQGRKLAALEAQLQQVSQELEQTRTHHAVAQDEIARLTRSLHEKEVEEGKLQTRLGNSQAAEDRLTSELSDRKSELVALNASLDDLRQQHRHTENELKTAQADIRASKEQVQDLSERLEKSALALEQERTLVSELKEQLAEEGKKAEGLNKTLEEARVHFRDQREALNEQKSAYEKLLTEHRALESEQAELKTTLARREEHFKEQMQQLSETRQSLTKEFENLANKIFEEKGKTFAQTSQTSIDGMLKPFRDQIEGFQKRINEVHDASLKDSTSLNSEIKKVLEIGLQMSKEANNLTSALKGDSQQRGAWGEAQLRRTLEMSGLLEDAHFEVQSAFKDAEGKQKQTDYLIKLPDGKHIIIDSKVSLNAYDRAIAAQSPEEYQLAMSEHVRAVRKHIDDLASKDYTNLVGMRSPSFVLMFMPIEPAYIEALKSNKDLFEYGYKKGIVLVSHTTLIPILRTVSNLWMIERSNAEAREISERAGEIYNQVCIVAERLAKLGNTLHTVGNHYNETVKALAGKQGLYGKVDRFSQLSAKVNKTLPQLEPTNIDFESERLTLIVEPIEEPIDEPAQALAALEPLSALPTNEYENNEC